jgi:bifunctional oligoribonuclease and PAP phosphatase NrnA
MNKEFREIRSIISRNRFFLIAFHRNPDGDALANALLWAQLFKRLGKQFRIVSPDRFPGSYGYMRDRYESLIKSRYVTVEAGKHFSKIFSKKLASAPLIMLDSSDISRSGPIAGELSNRPVIINLDHHGDNTRFGTVNCVDPKAAAVSEIFVRYLKYSKMKPDRIMDELIYLSIYSDTGGFTQQNMTGKTLRLLRELIGRKVDIRSLNMALQMRSPGKSKLIGRILSRIECSFNGRLLWSRVQVKDLEECNVLPFETDGLIEEMVKIRDALVIVLFKEIEGGVVKISLRSRSKINVREIAKSFKGGGHKAASGGEMKGTLDETVKKVIGEIRNKVGHALRG